MKKNEKKTNDRPRYTKEEIVAYKVSKAKERGSRIIVLNSPLGNIMFNVLRQFDQAYANLKGRLGEPGGISFEEGAELMDKAGNITKEFSDLTKKLSRKVGFRYLTPDELKSFNSQSAANTDKVEKTGEEKKETVKA